MFVQPFKQPLPQGEKLIKEVFRRIRALRMRLPVNKEYTINKIGVVQLLVDWSKEPAKYITATRLDMLQADLDWKYGDKLDDLQLACALQELKARKLISIKHENLIEVCNGKKKQRAARHFRANQRRVKKDDNMQLLRKTD